MDKVITIESDKGQHQMILDRVLRMVPDRDKQDVELKRLLAFRLRIDGEGPTREYLISKIRDMIQCAYTGRVYDFLKDNTITTACSPPNTTPDSPEIA